MLRIRVERADRFATSNARKASACPSPDLATRYAPTRQRAPSGLDGVELIALAVLATLLRRSGRSTSITVTDARVKWRAMPAP